MRELKNLMKLSRSQQQFCASSDPNPICDAHFLDALLLQIEVNHAQHSLQRTGYPHPDTDWLPEKDRPVLKAAIALRCDALVTGDRADFGSGFGRTFGGVTIHAPADLARVVLGQ